MNRELRLAVGLCVLGSVVVLVAVGRTWLSYATGGLTIDDVEQQVAGSNVSGVTRALGFVGLAGVVALAATRSWGRGVVGVLVALAGVGVVLSVVGFLAADPLTLVPSDCGGASSCFVPLKGLSGAPGGVTRSVLWPLVAALGGLLLVLAGALVAARGRRWAALSSSYEPPSSGTGPLPEPAAAASDKAVWDALDRGDDPTA